MLQPAPSHPRRGASAPALRDRLQDVPSTDATAEPVGPAPARVLLVASTGGHLKQLHRLRPRITRPDDDVTWLTFDTPQSRSLLAGEHVAFVPFTGPRDYRGLVGNLVPTLRLLRHEAFDRVISTGSAIALNALPAAIAVGSEAHYIESAARSAGPSLSGRLLAWTPGVRTYTQYRTWETDRWRFAGSVFDTFDAVEHVEPASLEGARVVVSLGTLQYGFPSLVRRLHELLPASAEVLWQLGGTEVPDDLPIEHHTSLPNHRLRAEIKAADVVVAHAGVGIALDALEMGVRPVLVPRRPEHGEHVDDHQVQIARELDRRGLATMSNVDDLDVDALHAAMGSRIVQHQEPVPFDLTAPGIRGALARGRARRPRRRGPRVQRLSSELA